MTSGHRKWAVLANGKQMALASTLLVLLVVTSATAASTLAPNPAPEPTDSNQAAPQTKPAASNSSEPLPPSMSKSITFRSIGSSVRVPKGAPLATPVLSSNGKVAQPCISDLSCYHWWNIVYYSQSANDYGGTFVAQPDTIGSWGCGTPLCTGPANDVLILPLNIDLGTDPGPQVWFQFDLDFAQYCRLGVCSNHVYFLIWNNPNPTGSCGDSITYNYDLINQTSPTSGTPGLPYRPGDSYEWHFYPTVTPNVVAFLIKDDTTGNFWVRSYSVPSENLVYEGSCFSPSVAVETYIEPSVTALTNVPFYQFAEGNDLQDIIQGGSSYIGGFEYLVTCDFCHIPTAPGDGYALGVYQSFIENVKSGMWYWTVFQAGAQNPVAISLPSGSGGLVNYMMQGADYQADYATMLAATALSRLTVPADPGSQVAVGQVTATTTSTTATTTATSTLTATTTTVTGTSTTTTVSTSTSTSTATVAGTTTATTGTATQVNYIITTVTSVVATQTNLLVTTVTSTIGTVTTVVSSTSITTTISSSSSSTTPTSSTTSASSTTISTKSTSSSHSCVKNCNVAGTSLSTLGAEFDALSALAAPYLSQALVGVVAGLFVYLVTRKRGST